MPKISSKVDHLHDGIPNNANVCIEYCTAFDVLDHRSEINISYSDFVRVNISTNKSKMANGKGCEITIRNNGTNNDRKK